MTETTVPVLQQIYENSVIGAVLVLSILALFWVLKKLLTDKDKTIEILRAKVTRKEEEISKKDEHINLLSKTLEKLVETVERNHVRNEGMLDKILETMASCREKFNSISNKLGSNS